MNTGKESTPPKIQHKESIKGVEQPKEQKQDICEATLPTDQANQNWQPAENKPIISLGKRPLKVMGASHDVIRVQIPKIQKTDDQVSSTCQKPATEAPADQKPSLLDLLK